MSWGPLKFFLFFDNKFRTWTKLLKRIYISRVEKQKMRDREKSKLESEGKKKEEDISKMVGARCEVSTLFYWAEENKYLIISFIIVAATIAVPALVNYNQARL